MATKQSTPSGWDKLRNLLDEAKVNAGLRNDLKTKSPAEVRNILLNDFDLTADEVTDLISEFENIADRNSLQWWSPLG